MAPGGGAGGRGGRGGGGLGLGLGLGFGVGWTLLLNFHSEPDDRRQDGVFARRSHRERQRLIRERTAHINRIKGSLFGQGIRDVEPRSRRSRSFRANEKPPGRASLVEGE
jgi:transposase